MPIPRRGVSVSLSETPTAAKGAPLASTWTRVHATGSRVREKAVPIQKMEERIDDVGARMLDVRVPIAKTEERIDDVGTRMAKTRVVIPKMRAPLPEMGHPIPKMDVRIAQRAAASASPLVVSRRWDRGCRTGARGQNKFVAVSET